MQIKPAMSKEQMSTPGMPPMPGQARTLQILTLALTLNPDPDPNPNPNPNPDPDPDP